MNTQALWQTFKPIAPYSWLILLWVWLFNVLYFTEHSMPVTVGVLIAGLLASMFTALAALAQAALTHAVKTLWESYQYHVRELEYKAKRQQAQEALKEK